MAHGRWLPPQAPGAGAEQCLLRHRGWEWGQAQSSQSLAQLVGLLGVTATPRTASCCWDQGNTTDIVLEQQP